MAIIRRDPWKEIGRWEPFQELERLQHEMNHLFDRFAIVGNGNRASMAFVPSAEMDETEEAFTLKLEVPGLEANDFDIQVTEDKVTVKGERKAETKTEEDGMVRSEFHYGTFERAISLPGKVKAKDAMAEYRDGILTLSLPKVEKTEDEAVKVAVGSQS